MSKSISRQAYKEIIFEGVPALVEVFVGDDAVNSILDGEPDSETRDKMLDLYNKGMCMMPRGPIVYERESLTAIGFIV